jgi:hypothetical protein
MLAATNAGGGGLSATVEATGGNGAELGEAGAATASVVATGAAGVAAVSTARGGSASLVDPGAHGGDATALASAIGAGSLSASSSATGGMGSLGGAAIARSSTEGSSGLADARAVSGGGVFASISAHGRASGSEATGVEAQALVQRAFETGPLDPQSVRVVGVGAPLPADVESALSGNPDATASIPEVLGMALFGASDAGNAADLAGDITFGFARGAFEAQDRLVLALLDVSFLGDFERLTFRISQNGAVLVNETFTEAGAVLAFFDDRVLALGPVQGIRISSLRLDWDLDGAAGGTTFAASALFGVVPEPGTGLLLLPGLIVLAMRRRPAPAQRGASPAIATRSMMRGSGS